MGIEPTLPKEHDFESCASTNSATLASVHCQQRSFPKEHVPIAIGIESLRCLSRCAGLPSAGGIYQFRHFGLLPAPARLKWGKFIIKVEFPNAFASRRRIFQPQNLFRGKTALPYPIPAAFRLLSPSPATSPNSQLASLRLDSIQLTRPADMYLFPILVLIN